MFRADLLPDGALIFENKIYEEPDDLLEELHVCSTRTLFPATTKALLHLHT